MVELPREEHQVAGASVVALVHSQILVLPLEAVMKSAEVEVLHHRGAVLPPVAADTYFVVQLVVLERAQQVVADIVWVRKCVVVYLEVLLP